MTAGSFSTDLGEVTVDLTLEEVGSSRVLGLAHYYSVANNETYGAVGWHQAYRTTGGTVVWNATATGTLANAYGVDANAYYRVYRVKATYTVTADQVANLPAAHTISGNIRVSSSDDSMITWKQDSAIAADNSAAPSGTFDNSAKAFTSIDLTTSWTGAAGEKTQYSATYFAISCDGEVHTSGDVTGTLDFASVSVA